MKNTINNSSDLKFSSEFPVTQYRKNNSLSDDFKVPNLGIGLGMIKDTFIVSENEEGLVLVDLHAAHERIIFEDMKSGYKNIFLKIDTQGFEENVLLGGRRSLKKIKLIQIEVSLEELYKGEKLFLQMCILMDELGFKVISLEPGFYSKNTGFLLQSDILFVKKEFGDN